MNKKTNWQKVLPRLALLIVSLAVLIMFPARAAYADDCVSIADGDWATSSTWSCTGANGVTIPGTDDNVTINNEIISQVGRSVNRVRLNGGNPDGTLNMGNNTLTLEERLTNNNSIAGSAAFTSTGELEFTTGARGIYGPNAVELNNITINDSTYFQAAPTIKGELKINQGGLLAEGSHSPIYGSSSTLIYNTGGSYERNLEWNDTSGAGYPTNIQISNNTTLVLGANSGTGIARQIAGTLTIDSGSILTMDSPSAMTADLTVLGDVINNGTLTLSSSAGGDLNVGGNWTNNATFTPNGRDVTFNGSSAQSIGGSSATTFHDLTINNSNGVTLNTDAAVDDTLTLTSGHLTLESQNLTLGTSATVPGTSTSSNMVVTNSTGELRKEFNALGSFTFPVGETTGTAEYSPATVEFTNGTFGAGAYVGVRVVDAQEPNHSDMTNYLTRYWSIEESGITGFSSDVTLQYDSSDVVGSDSPDLVGAQWDGSSWTSLGVVDSANDEVEGTVSSFSNFTGRDASSLAVNLAYFTANTENERVRLEWGTVLESNNLGFNLYRNTSPEFSGAERLNPTLIPAGAPGTGGGFTYEYYDDDVVSGMTYHYWLGDVEVGGHETVHQKTTSIDYAFIATSVRMTDFESHKPSNLSWLVMLTVLGMTIGVISMRRRQ